MPISAYDILKICSGANSVRIFYFLKNGQYLRTKVFPNKDLVRMTFGLYSAVCFSIQAWHDEIQLYCQVCFEHLGVFEDGK